jgi:hypothetical protein
VQTGGKSWTNHSGIIDYKGKSYFFYHNGDLPGGSDFTRSSCVEEFKYNADGTIPAIPMTKEGPPPVENLNPFVQTEAETIAFSSGLKTEVCSEGGMNVTSINNGDYIKVKSVDFRSGAVSFAARVASTAGGSIEMHLDSLNGTLMGACAIAGTGGAQTWATQTCDVSGATGIHDLFFKFTGGGTTDLFKFNWWKFTPKDPVPDAGAPDTSGDVMSDAAGTSGSGGATGSGGASGGSTTEGGSGGSTRGPGGSASGGGSGGRVTATGGSKGSAGTDGAGGSSGSGGAVRPGGSSAPRGGMAVGGATTGGSGGAAGSSVSAGGASHAGSGSGSVDNRASAGEGCSCQNAPGKGHSVFPLLVLLGAAFIRRHRPSARR